ncbi:MlaD family protein [Nevskia soli]|uniref:MlaD family protein n=1 Tax=Nevskia soli TaxID=418856 RepID=UPI0015D8B6B4|nr:MlaD family protein [Nevskia soli]
MPEERDEELEGIPRGTVLRVLVVASGGVLLVLVLAWLLSGGGTEFFDRKFTLHTYVADSAELAKGDDVDFSGVKVGTVKYVGLNRSNDPNRAVRIDLQVDAHYLNRIPVDSEATLTETNVVGDKLINITPGKATQHVEDGSEIPSLMQNGSFNPADLEQSLRDSLSRLDALFDEIQGGKTPLAQIIKGDDIYRNLETQVANIQKVIGNRRTPLGKQILGDELYEQISQPVLKVDRELADIQQGKGKFGRYLSSSADYDNWVAQARNIHKTLADDNAGKGAAGQWLTSDDRYNQLRARIESINTSVDNLLSPTSGFGKLLNSSEMYTSLNTQAVHIRDFTHEFRETPQKFMRIQVRSKKKKSPAPPQPAATKPTP